MALFDQLIFNLRFFCDLRQILGEKKKRLHAVQWLILGPKGGGI